MDPENSNKEAFTASLERHPTFRASKLVPPEILIQIFLLSLPPIHLGQAQHRTSLALVCRLWNNIIEATPMLWSQISFIDGPSNVKRALLKSAKSPIDVYGKWRQCVDRYVLGYHQNCLPFWREVERHSERWRSVELLMDDLEATFPLGPTYAPFLESVKLRSEFTIIMDDRHLTLVTSARAPRLRELSLDGTEFARWDLSFAPTLSHLIFENIRMSSSQILTVLAASPNLTVLHLSEFDNWVSDAGTPDSPFVELASLREVTITGIQNFVVRDVMAKLKFPSDCKVSLHCIVYDQDPRASFLDPALSQYRETFQQVGEIIQARVVVPDSSVQVVLRYLRWEIVLVLSDGRATLDTLEWFGITANTNVAASQLEDSPINSIPPPSNIPVLLELGCHNLTALLQMVNPLFNLKCINRIKSSCLWSPDEYNELFSYLAEPQVPPSPATTATTTSQEPGDNSESGPAIQNVAETWPFPGLCELAVRSSEDHVLRAAMALVKSRWPSSGVGLVPNRAASGRAPATRVPARLKRVEFGQGVDALPEDALPSDLKTWPRALRDLLETLDEDVQVFWWGKRISKAGTDVMGLEIPILDCIRMHTLPPSSPGAH